MKNHFYLVLVALLTMHGLTFAKQTQKEAVDVMSLPKFKEMTKDLSPQARFKTAAMMHIYLDQYEQAIPLLEVLVKKTPSDATPWMLLAMAYNRNGQPQDAFETANIAITLKPAYTSFYMERGIAAFELGKDREAVKDLSRFLKSHTTNTEAYYYLGLAYARLGELDAARTSLLKTRSLNPNLALFTDYCLGLIAARQGKTQEAKVLLKETAAAFKDIKGSFQQEVRRQLKQVESQTKAKK